MKKIISVLIVLSVFAGLFCSACSSGTSEEDGEYLYSPENFFGDAVHSLIPDSVYTYLFSDGSAGLSGTLSFSDMYFTDVETGERYSYPKVLDADFISAKNSDGLRASGSFTVGSKSSEFSFESDSANSKIYADSLLSEALTFDLYDLTGIGHLADVKDGFASLYKRISDEISEGLSDAVSVTESIELSEDENDKKVIKTVFSFGQDSSERIANNILSLAYSSENSLGELFGRYFFDLYGIDSENFVRYGENLRNSVSAAEDFTVIVEKYTYKNRLVRTVISTQSSDTTLCRKLTYSCTATDKASLTYENQSVGMPLFSIDLSDGMYTVDLNGTYSFSFKAQTPSDKMKTEISVRMPFFEEEFFICSDYSVAADGFSVSVDVYDENGTFGGKMSLNADVTDKIPEITVNTPDRGLVLENSERGASAYDKLASFLISEFSGFGKLIPSDISVSSDLGTECAATIGDDNYSLSAYLYFLQQSRDTCENIALNILEDGQTDTSDFWLIELPNGKTLEEYAYSLAEESYISSYYIIKYFNENGLSLSLSDYISVKNSVDSLGKDKIEEFCSRLGCSESALRYLYSVSYMQSKVFSDIYGEAGKTPVTYSDVKSAFDLSYAGIRFVSVFNFDPEDGSELDDETVDEIRKRAKECYKKVTTGEITMDDAIREYSDAYKYIPDQDERDTSEYFLGTTVGTDGESSAFTFPASMTEGLFDLKIGEYGYFEDPESGFWICERTDISDSLVGYYEQIRSELISTLQIQALSDWRSSQSYTMNESAVSKYDIRTFPSVFLLNADEYDE